mmetsp:Transcript_3499/g.7682  ORF Transcript_3499/g.7682 Transcript_3499/m.7682 type:complete len:90 (+) Transcript_3499:1124-1393(+)
MLDGTILITGAPVRGGNDWTRCKERLDRILGLIDYYQLKEAAPTFELALWKSEMEKMNKLDDANRASCLREVPGPTRDSILQFFSFNEP